MSTRNSQDMLIKFEDDVTLSKSSFQEKQKNQYMIKQKINGLPNIGNTCFLNSILQQLYALENFRYTILKKTTQNKMRVTCLLAKIFTLMKQRNSQTQIRKQIKNFITNIENYLLDYRFGQQNDSFDTLITIFNCIFEENPEISQMFQIQYSLKCKCSQQQSIFYQFYFSAGQSTCHACKSKSKISLKNLPQFFILKHKKNDNKIDINLSIDGLSEKYQLSSTNIYKGSGYSGHYYSICKRNNKFMQLNDSFASEINNPQTRYQHLFSIYAKERKLQKSYVCQKQKQISLISLDQDQPSYQYLQKSQVNVAKIRPSKQQTISSQQYNESNLLDKKKVLPDMLKQAQNIEHDKRQILPVKDQISLENKNLIIFLYMCLILVVFAILPFLFALGILALGMLILAQKFLTKQQPLKNNRSPIKYAYKPIRQKIQIKKMKEKE